MSTGNAYLTVRGIHVDVEEKNIKNLHIGVYPPTGRVRVAAPRPSRQRSCPARHHSAPAMDQTYSRSNCRMLLVSLRGRWSAESRTTSGVSASASRVIERPGRAHVEVDRRPLAAVRAEGSDREAPRREVLAVMATRANSGEPLTADHQMGAYLSGRSVSQWGVRRMKTKWGSCNRETAASG